jgi:hypothetical protein
MSETAGQLLLDESSLAIFEAAIQEHHGLALSDIPDAQHALKALSTGVAALEDQPDALQVLQINHRTVRRQDYSKEEFEHILRRAIHGFAFYVYAQKEVIVSVLKTPTIQEKELGRVGLTETIAVIRNAAV